ASLSPMAQVQGEVDNMEGPPASNNNNNPAARWESPDRGWEREPPAAANATAASLFECSRIKALADGGIFYAVLAVLELPLLFSLASNSEILLTLPLEC
ncbi:spectrin beta chain, brain 3-like protein, partial [Cricetulus griseus]